VKKDVHPRKENEGMLIVKEKGKPSPEDVATMIKGAAWKKGDLATNFPIIMRLSRS